MVASNFAKNRENFKEELCMNVILLLLFPLLCIVLSLRDVPETYSEQTEMGEQAVIWGGTDPCPLL